MPSYQRKYPLLRTYSRHSSSSRINSSLSRCRPIKTIFCIRSPYLSSQSAISPALTYYLYQFFFRCCGIPQTCFFQFLLHTGLFKKERHITIIAEITDSLFARIIRLHWVDTKRSKFMDIKKPNDDSKQKY